VTTSEIVNIQFPIAAMMTWDSYWRAVYEKANVVIQKQANELVARGNVTWEEARQLVEVQRNGLVIEMRKPLSPFGRYYSEVLKSSSDLPTLRSLVDKKGTVEAVLASVGKTRAVTNKIAFISRAVGPAGIMIEVAAVASVIAQAPAERRGETSTEEIGGAVGGLALGGAGMWGGAVAGAAWAGTWASPTLLVPVIGEFTEGGAVIAGGIVGGMLGSWVGDEAGKLASHELWRLIRFDWV
jgi:hypothetical protein